MERGLVTGSAHTHIPPPPKYTLRVCFGRLQLRMQPLLCPGVGLLNSRFEQTVKPCVKLVYVYEFI
jgi:hypothetical protein